MNGLVDHLFRRQSGMMVSTLTRILGPRHLSLAEDVVQEALVKAHPAVAAHAAYPPTLRAGSSRWLATAPSTCFAAKPPSPPKPENRPRHRAPSIRRRRSG